MEHHIANVPVCMHDSSRIYIRGIVINNILSVSLAWTKQFGFTRGGWTVRCANTGIRIATYRDGKLALNFARSILREYGDISAMLIRCASRTLTDADRGLLDQIHARAAHLDELLNGDQIDLIPVNSQ